MQGLYTNSFTDFEIQNMDIKTENFVMQKQKQSRVASKCGQYLLLGGLIQNQMNSTISFNIQALKNSKTIYLKFKYFLIDYGKTDMSKNTKIFLQVNENKSEELVYGGFQRSKLCGSIEEDIIVDFEKEIEVTDKQEFQIKIINENPFMNKNSSGTKQNIHPYFGIREITVFSINKPSCNQEQYYDIDGSCTECQKEGDFIDFQNNLCLKCDDQNCLKCSNNKNKCDTCKQKFKANINGHCAFDCEKGTFQKSLDSQICTKCSDEYTNCETCDNTKCLSCKNNFYILSKDEKQCDSCSKDGQFKNNETNKCEECKVQYCKDCQESQHNCKICNQDYLYDMSSNQCISKKCNSNEYLNTQTTKCENCQPKYPFCIECNTDSCIKCEKDLFLDIEKKQCSDCKQDGYYINTSQQICEKCKQQNCNKCTQDACDTCKPGYTKNLSTNICEETQCKQGQYLDKQQNLCMECSNQIKNCSECINSNSCNKCNNGFYLKNSNECIECNIDGYFKDQQKQNCIKCTDINCKKCSNQVDICDECNTSYIKDKQDTLCKLQCDKGQYFSNETQTCLECSKKFNDCNQCIANICISCSEASKNPYLNTETNKCIDKCEYGSYEYIKDNQKECRKCLQTNCINCKKENPEQCLQCINGLFLNAGKCMNDCGDLLIDKKKSICYNICPKNLVKQENECINMCKDGYFYEIHSRSCQLCNISCNTCEESQNNCLSCKEGYKYHELTSRCIEIEKLSDEQQKMNDICSDSQMDGEECKQIYQSQTPFIKAHDILSLISFILSLINIIFMTKDFNISMHFIMIIQLQGNQLFSNNSLKTYFIQSFIKVSYAFNVFTFLPNIISSTQNNKIQYHSSTFDSYWPLRDVYSDFMCNFIYQSVIIIGIFLTFVIFKVINIVLKKMQYASNYLLYKLLVIIFLITSNQLIVCTILHIKNSGFNPPFFIAMFVMLIYLLRMILATKDICFSKFDSIQLEKLKTICFRINQQRKQQLFWLFFEAKKILSTSLIIIFSGNLISQIFDAASSFVFFLYVLFVSPLLERNENLTIATSEILYFGCKILEMVMNSQDITSSQLSIVLKSIYQIILSKFISHQFLLIQKVYGLIFIIMNILLIGRYSLLLVSLITKKIKNLENHNQSYNAQLNVKNGLSSFNNIEINTQVISDILSNDFKSYRQFYKKKLK